VLRHCFGHVNRLSRVKRQLAIVDARAHLTSDGGYGATHFYSQHSTQFTSSYARLSAAMPGQAVFVLEPAALAFFSARQQLSTKIIYLFLRLAVHDK
jgi:hypothetical protein